MQIGPVGNFPPGAPVAASQQFGVSGRQTDVFVVENSSTLTVSWVAGGGQWSVECRPYPELTKVNAAPASKRTMQEDDHMSG
jgi:hypothetical protein